MFASLSDMIHYWKNLHGLNAPKMDSVNCSTGTCNVWNTLNYFCPFAISLSIYVQLFLTAIWTSVLTSFLSSTPHGKGSAAICCCPDANCGHITMCTELLAALAFMGSAVVLYVHIQAARIWLSGYCVSPADIMGKCLTNEWCFALCLASHP